MHIYTHVSTHTYVSRRLRFGAWGVAVHSDWNGALPLSWHCGKRCPRHHVKHRQNPHNVQSTSNHLCHQAPHETCTGKQADASVPPVAARHKTHTVHAPRSIHMQSSGCHQGPQHATTPDGAAAAGTAVVAAAAAAPSDSSAVSNDTTLVLSRSLARGGDGST